VRRAAVVAVSLGASLLLALAPAPAAAQPPPTPPSNPSDNELESSGADVASKAGEIGRLTGELTRLQGEAEELQMQLGAQREAANQALVDLQLAEDAAAEAARAADAARLETDAATSAIDAARVRVDEFAALAYQQGLGAGSLGLLMTAASPEDALDRAHFAEIVAEQQLTALDTLERARVAKANADSTARAARERAEEKAAAALGAKQAADSAVNTAEAAAAAQERQLQSVDERRVAVEQALADAESRDAGLRAQRQRYTDWQAAQAAAQAANENAEQSAARGRLGAGGGDGTIQDVIDRAVSQLGVTYAWGGGTAGGPSRGIRDGGTADRHGDYRKVGFDCSGLMIYAFAAIGARLPHYSGYQYNSGRKVPLAQRQPGDMLFWAYPGGRIHHVALYLGNGRMVEAPFSGGKVRIVPVRMSGGLLPYATRMI
jgi:cell wall-associated NlpC family hydrolase